MNMSSSTPLRVCFLTGRDEIADWMVASLRRIVKDANVEIPLVVHASEPDEDTLGDSGVGSHLKEHCSAGVQYVKNIVRRDPQTHTSLSNIEWLGSAKYLPCEAEPTEPFGVTIPSDVVEAVADTCDAVVHFQVGILQGEILTQPTHGVLSFHHGDIRQYRGTPAGIWEFLHDEPVGGVTLQRLTPKLDAGYIVAFASVDLTDAHSWAEVRRRLFYASPNVLSNGLQNIQDPSFDPVLVPDEELGTLYYLSDLTPRIQAAYFLKEVKGLLYT